MNVEMLNSWLQRLQRKQECGEYLPVYSIFHCMRITASLREENIHNMNFLDEHEHRFTVFRKVLDARIKELLSKGLGKKVRQADPIMPEDGENF